MKGFFCKLKKNKKGYTLTELIVVVAILGVLAAIAVPMIMNAVQDSRQNADLASAKAIETAVQLCLADGSLYFDTSTPPELKSNSGTIPETIVKKLVGKEYPVNNTGTIPSGITDKRVWYLKLDTGKVSKDNFANPMIQLN